MPRRVGSAPLVVLLCMAVAELIAAGSLLVATRTLVSARQLGAVARARAGAEGAVRAGMAGWDRSGFAMVAVGDRVPVPAGDGVLVGDVRHSATVERLGPDRWLLRGSATVHSATGPVARARAAALLVSIPQDTLWHDFAAALTSGEDAVLAAGTRIDGLASDSIPSPWTGAHCPGEAVAAMRRRLGPVARPGAAMGAGASLSESGAVVVGNPPLVRAAARTDSAALQRVGALELADLARLADRVESGSLTPAPAGAGATCDISTPANWGAPLQPAHACGDYFPVIFSAGDLTVVGGAGQGLLVVTGDLTMIGTTFFGAVMTGGRLVARGSSVHGALRIRRGTAEPADLHVTHSACALWRVFERAPALRRAYRPPGRWWLPGL